jgi:hypothetical protein
MLPSSTGNSGSPPSVSSCPADKSVIVGASVGAIVGTAFLAALAGIVLMQRKLGKIKQEHFELTHTTKQANNGSHNSTVHEMDGKYLPQEMPQF